MFYVLLWIYVIANRVHSEELASPQDVHVNNSLLIWTPAHTHNNVTYTVQYLSSDSEKEKWKDVQSCIETAETSCDVTRTQEAAKYGCVGLRVQAHTHNLTSTPAEACTRLGDSCGPSVGLSAQSGTLSVTLSSNHRLLRNHRHAEYRVYYGLESQPQEDYIEYENSRSSVSIRGLDEGKRYCVYVQIVAYDKINVGPPSCTKCKDIPKSGEQNTTIITIAVFAVFAVVVLSVAIAYILLYQYRRINRIKKWFKPEPLPECLWQQPHYQHPLIASTPEEDRCDRISFISTQEERGLTSVQET